MWKAASADTDRHVDCGRPQVPFGACTQPCSRSHASRFPTSAMGGEGEAVTRRADHTKLA